MKYEKSENPFANIAPRLAHDDANSESVLKMHSPFAFKSQANKWRSKTKTA